MAITLDQAVLKIVIQFKSSRSETQIRNYLVNTVWAKLESKIDAKMDANFDAGWTKNVKLKVNKSLDPDGVEWTEIYPKFTISGTTNLTGTQLKTGVSDLLRDLKTTLKDEFQSQGATNVSFHIHYQDGRVKEIDET